MDKRLTPKQFQEMMKDGAIVIDARDSAAFEGFHIPGSINIGFEKQLANWAGMVVDPNSEILLVVDNREDYDRMVTELHRIGYDLIFGNLSGGIMAWLMSGRPANQLEQISPQQLSKWLESSNIRIIDVRTPAEWNSIPALFALSRIAVNICIIRIWHMRWTSLSGRGQTTFLGRLFEHREAQAVAELLTRAFKGNRRIRYAAGNPG